MLHHSRIPHPVLVLLAVLASSLSLLVLPGHASAGVTVYLSATSEDIVSVFDAGLDGSLTAQDPPSVSTGSYPDGITLSPDGNSIYVANSNAESVSQYDVDADGSVAPKDPPTVATGNDPASIGFTPDGGHAYVVNNGSSTVSLFDVDAGGRLTAKTPATVVTDTNPSQIAVSRDGRSAYVTNLAGNSISQYDVAADGTLSPKDPALVPATLFPFGIVLSGNSAYVTAANGYRVWQYDIDAGGRLTPKDPAFVFSGRIPGGIAASPDGQNVYVANQADDTISQYTVGSGGKLAPKNPATVPAAINPFAVAAAPDGRSLYVGSSLSADVSQYDVATDGRLTPKPVPVVASGEGARGIAVRADTIAPRVTVDSGPSGTVSAHDASFGFHAGEAGASLSCSLDGGGFAACSPPQAYTAIPDGPHVFTVRATDAYGNSSEASRTWTVATLPPGADPAGPDPEPASPDPDPASPDPTPPDANPQPSNLFSFGAVRLNKRRGTAVLAVKLPGEGSVELAGSARITGARASTGGPGEVFLRIRPQGTAKRTLREAGRARVRARVTFTPTGGTPSTRAMALELRRVE